MNFRVQINEFDLFVRLEASSFFSIDMFVFEHKSAKDLKWHVRNHY